MKLLFNNNDLGNQEIKNTLGFLEAGFNYANLEPDIKLTTPYLVDLVGQDVYDKVQAYYVNPGSVTQEPEKTRHEDALSYMQLYLLSMAYLDYAPDNDLNHGNAGRSFRNEENEKLPWEWQIDRSDRSIKKRAYKALDHLMALLDGSGWTEWTDSDQYKATKAIFIQSTATFEQVFPIGKSGQLYYRLVPFMKDLETHKVAPILTPAATDALRAKADPTPAEKVLVDLIRKAVAYLSLGKAYKLLPVEMMPEGLYHNETPA